MAMMKIKRGENSIAASVLAVALLAFAVAGCVVGKNVNWQTLDITRALSSDAGNQKWNTYRFETAGPYPYQRIAYVLFADDVTVDMWSVPYADLGKKSLREVLEDHDAYLKSRMWTGTVLGFKVYEREGKVIAYTANELEMEVDLWEMTASGSKVGLRMVYTDRRSFSGGDSGADNSPGR
jgi:hypothetical protein